MKRVDKAIKPSFEENLYERVYLFIKKYQLWNFKDRIIIAVSGGRDSTALLHILHHLSLEPSSLFVAHFDHGARHGSIDDVRAVEEMTESMGIGFRSQRQAFPVPKGTSKEAFWRKTRYTFLNSVMTEEDAVGIATGHTADDQLETLTYRLITGCGPRGLLGIRRSSQNGIFRPLLATTRRDIDTYISRHNLTIREDPSNTDETIPRNFIRHSIAPLMKHLNPQVHIAIQSLIDLQGTEDDYMAAHSRELYDTLSTVERNCVRLKTDLVRPLHPALLRRIAFHVLKSLDEETAIRMDRTKMDALVNLFLGTQQSLSLHPGIKGRWREDFIWIYKPVKTSQDLITAQQLDCPGSTQFGTYTICANIVDRPEKYPPPSTAIYLDSSTLPLRIRTGNSSDYFHPVGMPAKIKLNHFYRNRRIPSGLRSAIPVIVNSDQDIVAVVGYGTAVKGVLDAKMDRAVKLTWKHG